MSGCEFCYRRRKLRNVIIIGGYGRYICFQCAIVCTYLTVEDLQAFPEWKSVLKLASDIEEGEK
jgi:hypothetical protein